MNLKARLCKRHSSRAEFHLVVPCFALFCCFALLQAAADLSSGVPRASAL